MAKKKKPMTQRELSLLGGAATFKKHGKRHYQKMLLKRWHPEEYEAKYGLKSKKK